MKVLIIEDNRQDFELIYLTLRKAINGIKIVQAERLDQLKGAKYENYDCIVCDYKLQLDNGMDCYKYLETQGVKSPFIMFTGYLSEEKSVEIIRQGVDYFMIKDHLQALPSVVVRLVNQNRKLNTIIDGIEHKITEHEKRIEDRLKRFE